MGAVFSIGLVGWLGWHNVLLRTVVGFKSIVANSRLISELKKPIF
jgi:hypothetical protein